MMKHLLKCLLICALLTLILPAGALADEMSRDDFAQVSCGGTHTLALRNNGDLWAWGYNGQGQVGNGGASDSVSREGDYPCQAKPVLVLDEVVAIAAGETHSLAIRKDGSLWGWGANYHGELGNGGKGDVQVENGVEGAAPYYQQTVPIKIMDDVAAVTAGSDFTLILKTDGTLWGCGRNDNGQMGNGGQGNATEPVYNQPIQTEPIQIMEQVTAIDSGVFHALAVKEDGSLWAWGSNGTGQLGNDGQSDSEHERYGVYQSLPVQVFESGVMNVSAGYNHSLAIMEDGALWGWGDNSGQQLLDSEDEKSFPTPRLLLADVRLADAAQGRTLAIREDDSLWGWGNNNMKALNYNYTESEISGTPRKIMDNIADVSSGWGHTMAVKKDGTLWGWGNNSYGQLSEPPGEVGLPVRVKVEYPADAPEPEEEVVEETLASDPDTEPDAPDRGNPLPFIIGCGVIVAGGLTAALVWRHKKNSGGVGAWRK